jgi:hypothetical protein
MIGYTSLDDWVQSLDDWVHISLLYLLSLDVNLSLFLLLIIAIIIIIILVIIYCDYCSIPDCLPICSGILMYCHLCIDSAVLH